MLSCVISRKRAETESREAGGEGGKTKDEKESESSVAASAAAIIERVSSVMIDVEDEV